MKILIVSATGFELAPLLQHLEEKHSKTSFFEYQMGDHQIFPLVTGVGSMMTSFALARYKGIEEIDLAINIGLCGSFDANLLKTEVLHITKDRFADLGIEEADGSFTDLFELELADPKRFPYDDGWLSNASPKYSPNLKTASAITVNRVHGKQESIDAILTKYRAQTESMEGAAFFYACKALDVDAVQIRSISNYVESRNRDNWDIDGALTSLNNALINFLEGIKEAPPSKVSI